MSPDDIARKTPLSETELAADRARIVAMYADQGLDIESFTCDECGARYTFILVFDAYNTDGDCLAEK